jgi:hypothetical protein
MSAATFIRVLVLSGGERLPTLFDGASGQPLFDPLVYVTTRLRGRAANTIHQHVVAIARLLAFCSERRIAVFAPPARRGVDEGANDLSPPSALAENFAFLSERLDWYGELAEARAFLVHHKLIQDFDRESILTQLARVLREDTRNASRSAGLRWAFQIWRGPQERGRSVTLALRNGADPGCRGP